MAMKSWQKPKIPVHFAGTVSGYKAKTGKNGNPYAVMEIIAEDGQKFELPCFKIESNEDTGHLGKARVTTITEIGGDTHYEVEFI